MWVRVSSLPLGCLGKDWAIQALKHVGSIVEIESEGDGLHYDADFSACLMIDFSQPLIPGCFIPLSNNQSVWVDFRYEGIFKYCKKMWLHWPLH